MSLKRFLLRLPFIASFFFTKQSAIMCNNNKHNIIARKTTCYYTPEIKKILIIIIYCVIMWKNVHPTKSLDGIKYWMPCSQNSNVIRYSFYTKKCHLIVAFVFFVSFLFFCNWKKNLLGWTPEILSTMTAALHQHEFNGQMEASAQ